MAKSILQEEKECYICGTTLNLEKHHIYGAANRKLSEKYGCVVWLCKRHHTGAAGVHFNKKIRLTLQARCEVAFLQKYNKTIEDFIENFRKNYI